MALISINPVQQKEKGPSALEKVALAFDIATKALGAGLSVPKFIQDRKLGQLEQGKAKAEIGKTTDPAIEGEPGAFPVPDMGLRKPRKVLDFAEEIQKNKFLESKPLKDNADLYLHIRKNAPEIADIPGISISEAREKFIQKSTTDPRLELALKQFDLSMKNYTSGQEKTIREEFKKGFNSIRDRVNKIKDTDIGGLELADRAKKFINTGSKIGASTAAAVVAKSVGRDTGALTESDIQRYLPATLESRGIEIFNYITGRSDAPLSDATKAALLQVVDSAERDMRKNLAFKIHSELSQEGASDPEFFSRPEVQAYKKSLGRQIRGLEKVDLIDQLKDQIEANPNRAAEIQQKIDQLMESF